jgi:hypothetical protein
MHDLRDRIMGRPANSSADGKRDFEVKVSLSESEFEDVIVLRRALGFQSNSEVFRQLLALQAYGLIGHRSSHDLDDERSAEKVRLRVQP